LKMVRIGTRGSRLAMWQATRVAEQLRHLAAPARVEIVEVTTAGDREHDLPLSRIGGEGAFTKEIQRALLAKAVDIAVHSLKDLPTTPVEGLMLAAVPARGPTADVLVSREKRTFAELPQGARIATGSLRRRAQLLYRRPDLNLLDIRGNVETRLRKLAEQDFDGLILARAGLERLGLDHVITEVLSTEWMLPAVGQGALGLECRQEDLPTQALLQKLDDRPTHQAVLAERALLASLGGGCLVPIGAATEIQDEMLMIRGAVLDPAGSRRVSGRVGGALCEAESLGHRLARELLTQGARELLVPAVAQPLARD
jgi:hydroxymethylbilane synthase